MTPDGSPNEIGPAPLLARVVRVSGAGLSAAFSIAVKAVEQIAREKRAAQQDYDRQQAQKVFNRFRDALGSSGHDRRREAGAPDASPKEKVVDADPSSADPRR